MNRDLTKGSVVKSMLLFTRESYRFLVFFFCNARKVSKCATFSPNGIVDITSGASYDYFRK